MAQAEADNKGGRQVEVVFGSPCGTKLLKADYLTVTKNLHLKDLQQICSYIEYYSKL